MRYIVGLADTVSPTDIEEGMRVGCATPLPLLVDLAHYNALTLWCRRIGPTKLDIHIPLPPRIDPSVTLMTVEERPDVTYDEVGGCIDQIRKIKEVVELPLLDVPRDAALTLTFLTLMSLMLLSLCYV